MKKVMLFTLMILLVVSTTAYAAQYKRYYNARFGFSVDVPSNSKITVEPVNGDGKEFTTKDGKAVVITSGINNVLEYTVQSAYKQQLDSLMSNKTKIAYKRIKNNWFVISYVKGDSIIYYKEFVGKGSINDFTIKYSKKYAKTYNKITEHIAGSFKTGDLNASH